MSKKSDASEAAKTLGKLGASKGGQARAQSMTPEERQDAARKAVLERWRKARQATQNKTLAHWQDDVAKRQKTLGTLAAFTKASVQAGNLVGTQAPFLVLHFDLMTISPTGDADRSATYKSISVYITKVRGMKLGESVYLVPALAKSSRECARDFWNVLSDGLKGHLAEGDLFALHYVPDEADRMGVVSEVVGKDRALTRIDLGR